MRSRSRRRFLRGLIGAAGLAAWGAEPNGFGVRGLAQTKSAPLAETTLRDGLHLLSGAGGNIVLLEGTSGIAMVDSGAPEHAGRVMRHIAERHGGAPVEVLFNTHWHLAHTGGNEAVARPDARIIAHENTRLWMSTEFYVDWQDRTYAPRPAEARPNETFFSSDPQPLEVAHAGQRIEYGHLREAHTDGDIYVRFPDHDVIVAGGAVSVGEYPVVDYITGGALDGLIAATAKLLALGDAETLFVPAAGPAQPRSHLAAQHEMLSVVAERMETMARQGKSVDEMLAAGITDEFDPKWGSNAKRFLANAYLGRWGIGL